MLTGTGSAVVNAAVPTFDVGNLVLFPNRDFITVEGYQSHIGETATITGHPGQHRDRFRQSRRRGG